MAGREMEGEGEPELAWMVSQRDLFCCGSSGSAQTRSTGSATQEATNVLYPMARRTRGGISSILKARMRENLSYKRPSVIKIGLCDIVA